MSSDNSEVEKNLPPSERKLEQARESGSGLKAPDLMLLLAVALVSMGLFVSKGAIVSTWMHLLDMGDFWTPRDGLKVHALFSAAFDVLAVVVGVLCVSGAITALVSWILNGYIFSMKAISLDLTRLNPFARLAEMFSNGGAQVWWPLAKGMIALSLMVIGVKMFVEMIYDGKDPISAVLFSSAPSIVGFAVFAILDFLLQVWRRKKSLGMSLQELKDEFKESEGDPAIKAKMRAIARQRSRSRMMAAIATADVVVVNPEHYLVALAWRSKKASAPIVVARARDLVALSLKERAKALDIPVLEAPPFARALWATSKLDEPIPLSYYESIAALLAWAYAIKDGKTVVEPILSAPVDAGVEVSNA